MVDPELRILVQTQHRPRRRDCSGRARRRMRAFSITTSDFDSSASGIIAKAADRRLMASVSFQTPPRNRMTAGLVEVSGQDDPPILLGACHYDSIGRKREIDCGGVNSIVSLARELLGQRRRQRHIHQKFHPACSTVSSSARNAA